MGKGFKFIFEYNEYLEKVSTNRESVNDDNYIYNQILESSRYGKLTFLEGLIHTHPVDKSVNIIKRKFPNIEVTIETDGEIFIECLSEEEIGKFIPIITNLGYFVSKWTIDGNQWLSEYENNTKVIGFYLEPKYDYLVKIPNILYHASPIKFKHKILKYGLSPRSGSKLSSHPNRIYLSDDINKCISFGEYLKTTDNDNPWYQNGYCIYSVKGTGISKLYSDINFRVGGFYTTDNINIENISLIKEII